MGALEPIRDVLANAPPAIYSSNVLVSVCIASSRDPCLHDCGSLREMGVSPRKLKSTILAKD